MQVKETGFEGLYEIIPSVYADDRGWFFECYKEEVIRKYNIPTHFPQENMSFSKKGVIRGMHFQRAPYAQGKLVSVIKGRVIDVAIDLRPGSVTFGKTYYCELDDKRHNMLMVPEGFAHGFAALEETIFQYKCTNVYKKECESGIVWNDPELKIEWPFSSPIVSEKDLNLPTFSELLGKSVISKV
ncbi:dTDP-4-dehydrorhamnose 3,5-epimerase [Chryseosolibacter indicus]|uniref:dTDP-4-dehydrorhamnose 3,5-epimerase n=1 Tax=Chryseosolibacter indicus TaxID=2782351 RepID=A0ABS5VXT3_9BACT|nr:dTDP-4-dehydrorhamnose 3,5-epimerase [Chryseosolibacter indicus]MBT1705734.1 dTDP-4-dehydrorhamnose 3,5-epimerase [Chryseosolibacter indicus]